MRQYCEIPGYTLDFNNKLGSGASSIVYLGTDKTTQAKVAIKIIPHSSITNQVTQYLFEAEKYALTHIKNQYVIQAKDIISYGDHWHIITQYCQNGTLKDYIQSKGKLSEREALHIFRKIINGYCSIISSQIIHRDLKPANIMLRANGDPVIIDFGYSQMILGKRPTVRYNVGSPSYMSPQSFYQNLYSQRSDVWSLGAIYYQMLTGRVIDEDKKIDFYFKQVLLKGVVQLKYHQLSQFSVKLLKSALVVNLEKRATALKLRYLIDIHLGPSKFNLKEKDKDKIRNIQRSIKQKNYFGNKNINIKDEGYIQNTYTNRQFTSKNQSIQKNLYNIGSITSRSPSPLGLYNYNQLFSPSHLRNACYQATEQNLNYGQNTNKISYYKFQTRSPSGRKQIPNQVTFNDQIQNIIFKSPQKQTKITKKHYLCERPMHFTQRNQTRVYTQRSPPQKRQILELEFNNQHYLPMNANPYYTERIPEKTKIKEELKQLKRQNKLEDLKAKSYKKYSYLNVTKNQYNNYTITTKKSSIQSNEKSITKDKKLLSRKPCYSINTPTVPHIKSNTFNQLNQFQSAKTNDFVRKLGQGNKEKYNQMKKTNKQVLNHNYDAISNQQSPKSIGRTQFSIVQSPVHIRQLNPVYFSIYSPKVSTVHSPVISSYKNRMNYFDKNLDN